LDVTEMDAASNNSVEDIRELRERIAFAPVSGHHKVYILDEAHMLSPAAWNAFLKTLEEPPPATVFVLATTEAQKVPATVIDRCHCFEFQRPSADQISSVVRRVAQREDIDIPPEAVAAIARSATGSFRDAVGTLEQLVTYSGSRIELGDVLAVLGFVAAEILEEILEAVGAGDGARVLLAISRCVESGRDASALTSDLESRARDLLVVQTLGKVPRELSLTPEADASLASQASRLERPTVVRLLELLGIAREATRAGADARTQLELALVKAASPQVDGSTAALLARVERLEASIGDAEGGAPADASGNGSLDDVSGQQPAGDGRSSERTLDDAAVHDLESLREHWPRALELIRAENALLGALIAEAQPVALDGDEVTLAFAPTAAFLKRKAEDRTHYAAVAETLRQVTGRRVRLSYELRDAIAQPTHTPGEEELVARLMAELDAEELSPPPTETSH
jgi:DNA polymerase-3 subunit gamma/tau